MIELRPLSAPLGMSFQASLEQGRAHTAQSIFGAIGLALRVTRDLVLTLWVIGVLAFCAMIVVAGML